MTNRVTNSPALSLIVKKFAIRSWLIEPVFYQGRLLGNCRVTLLLFTRS